MLKNNKVTLKKWASKVTDKIMNKNKSTCMLKVSKHDSNLQISRNLKDQKLMHSTLSSKNLSTLSQEPLLKSRITKSLKKYGNSASQCILTKQMK